MALTVYLDNALLRMKIKYRCKHMNNVKTLIFIETWPLNAAWVYLCDLYAAVTTFDAKVPQSDYPSYPSCLLKVRKQENRERL